MPYISRYRPRFRVSRGAFIREIFSLSWGVLALIIAGSETFLGLDSDSLATAQPTKYVSPNNRRCPDFARLLTDHNGDAGNKELNAPHAVAYVEGEIAEIAAVATFNIFQKISNKLAETTLNFA